MSERHLLVLGGAMLGSVLAALFAFLAAVNFLPAILIPLAAGAFIATALGLAAIQVQKTQLARTLLLAAGLLLLFAVISLWQWIGV